MGDNPEQENIYRKLVSRNEISDSDDLSIFAQLRISSLHTRSSTGIATIVGYLAILLAAYYPAIQAARETDNLPLGFAITAVFGLAMWLVIRFVGRQAKKMSPEETLVEFKRFLEAKQLLANKTEPNIAGESPLMILKSRLSKGEITLQEYETIRQALEK